MPDGLLYEALYVELRGEACGRFIASPWQAHFFFFSDSSIGDEPAAHAVYLC